MVNKKSNKTFDIFEQLLYSKLGANKPDTLYEKEIIKTMIDEKCTLRRALDIDFASNSVDVTNVFSLTDYLEEKLIDLNKVSWFMKIYLHQTPDLYLKPLKNM